MSQNRIYKIRMFVIMVLSMLLFWVAPTQAAFLVKKQTIDKPLFSQNTSALMRLSEKLTAFKKQKGSYISKAKLLFSRESRMSHGYGERSSSNLLSILSLVCGCVAYLSIFAGLFAFVLTLNSSVIVGTIVGGGVFALAAIILGAVALNKHQSRGMAITGIILGSILITMYAFVWLILLSYA